MRGLVQARRLMLASQVDEALGAIERIELQLDDVPPLAARRFRAGTQLLRAAGLAYRDNSLAALAIALSHLKGNGANRDQHAAATLCRLGFWQLGEFDVFHSLPRHQLRLRWSKSWAISAVLDLSIEAAAALDQMHIFTAKRLASDASAIAEAVPGGLGGLSALPATLTAQVLYEEGLLDQAERILRDRLPAINAVGPIDCALPAYLILTRIARHRMQYDFAALLLRDAEALGERRGWPRLVAACLAERTSLLLREGRQKEARLSFEHLDRHAETHRAGSGYTDAEIARYRTLTRWRVSWSEAPSVEAVAALRQFYHQAIEKRDLYRGCRLAGELAEMLAVIGETEEADALTLHTLQAGAAAGLYQAFLEGGEGSGMLLKRAYARCGAQGSADSEILPILGSLLSQWDGRHAERQSAHPANHAGDTLSARESEILGLIDEGFPNKQIARALAISPETVKSHLKRIFLKLAACTRTEALSRARSLGLL
jgi:ATP/maltotriose-dependent transcriptional regulator MalT